MQEQEAAQNPCGGFAELSNDLLCSAVLCNGHLSYDRKSRLDLALTGLF